MGKKSRKKRERRLKKSKQESYQPPKEGVAAVCLRVILWATYLALFAPLIISGEFFFPFVGPKSLYFMALAEIIFVAYLLLILFAPQYRPKLNMMTAALLCFLAVIILSTVFGEDFSRSFWSKYERMTGLLMYFHLLAFFVAISSVFKKKDWHMIFGISLFVAILISILSLLFNIGVRGLFSATRGGATIGNSSFMATYLLFNLFLALYLYFKTTGGVRIYAVFSFILIAGAMYASGGRAAIGSTCGGLLLLGLFWFTYRAKGKLKIASACLLAIFVIVSVSLILFTFWPPGNVVYEKFAELATRSRQETAKMAIQAWQERPWLGWGPENFELAFPKFFHPSFFLREYGGEVWFDRVHIVVFDTLVTTGILGLLSYLAIFAVVFLVLGKRCLEGKVSFWTAAIFSAMLASYFVQNLTVFDMVSSYLMFFLVLGFVASIVSAERTMTPRKRSPLAKPWVVGIILIFFSFSFFKFIIQPARTDRYVIVAVNTNDPKERVSLFKKTLETSPLGKYQIRAFFAEYVSRFIRSEAAARLPKEDVLAHLDFITEELEKSCQASPRDYRSCLSLGQAYNLYGPFNTEKLTRAAEVLERVIELSPTNQQGYWALAQTKLYQQEPDEAFALGEKAMTLEPRVQKSHMILIEIALRSGKPELATQKAKEALEIDPSWEEDIVNILGSKPS